MDVIDRELLLINQLLEVVLERTDILDQLLGPFLKCNEDSWLIVLDCAIVEKSHCEEGFAATGGPAEQGGSSLRQPALA